MTAKTKPTKAQLAAYDALCAAALALPGAWQDNPWGHVAIKVGKKVFAFLSNGNQDQVACAVGLTVKLPLSAGAALSLPFASPTGYGLGKAGWVDLRFGAGDVVPTDILVGWLRESYRAVAPKTLAKQLDTTAPAAPTKNSASKKAKKKTTKKRP